jgi:hypothetical protein
MWNGGDAAHPQLVCTACDDPNALPTAAHVGRFVAVGRSMNINAAIDYCEQHYASLASIHSWEEEQQAASACTAYSDATETTRTNADGSDGHNAKYGCWIGFQDLGSEGGFAWYDGASVDYADWAVGEPNDVNGGEDAVEMDFRDRLKVRARRGRSSALSVFHSKSFLYGAFVWVRRALNKQKRRFPARAEVRRVERCACVRRLRNVPGLRDVDPDAEAGRADELGDGDHRELPRARLRRPGGHASLPGYLLYFRPYFTIENG